MIAENNALAAKLNPSTSAELEKKQTVLKDELSALRETNAVLNNIVASKVIEPTSQQLEEKQKKLVKERDAIREQNRIFEQTLQKEKEKEKKRPSERIDFYFEKPVQTFDFEEAESVRQVSRRKEKASIDQTESAREDRTKYAEPSIIFVQTPAPSHPHEQIFASTQNNVANNVSFLSPTSSQNGGGGGGNKTGENTQTQDDGEQEKSNPYRGYFLFFGGFVTGVLGDFAFHRYRDYKEEKKRNILIAQNEEIQKEIEEEKRKRMRLLDEIDRQRNK